MHSSNGAHPRIVFVVAEEVGDAPDEGYAKVVQELTPRLSARRHGDQAPDPGASAGSA